MAWTFAAPAPPKTYNVKDFGATGNGTTDDSVAVQAAFDAATANLYAPGKVYFPIGTYLLNAASQGVLINVRNAGVTSNFAQLRVEGESGGGDYAGSLTGVTLKRTVAGPIIRMCELATQAYPGGGVGVVTLPLNFLRRVHLSDLNFLGTDATIDGFVGRGIYSSTFERLGFNTLGRAIRCGDEHTIATASYAIEQSADLIDLDYCEQNTLIDCKMKDCEYHISIVAGDTTRIVNCYLSQCLTAAGNLLRFAAGNDPYYVSNTILHPITTAGVKLTGAIYLNLVGSVIFACNHFEHWLGILVTGTFTGLFQMRGNHILNLALTAITNNAVVLTAMRPYSTVIIEDNMMVGPDPSVFFLNVTENGGILANSTKVYVQRNDAKTDTTQGATAWFVDSSIGPILYSEYKAATIALTTPVTVPLQQRTTVTKLSAPGAVAVTLPTNALIEVGTRFTIVDGTGDAATNNVTITPSSGTINGAATYILTNNWGSVTLEYLGSNLWSSVADTVMAANGSMALGGQIIHAVKDSGTESFYTASVVTDAVGKFELLNGTGSANLFIPTVRMTAPTTQTNGLTFVGTTDTGSNPILRFTTRIGASTAVATRTILDLYNHTTLILNLTAAGVLAVTGSAPGISTTGTLGITGLSTLTGGFSSASGEIHKLRVATTTPVTVATTDYLVISKLAAPGAVAVTLPATPETGRIYVVKDGTGDAATNNITVTPAAGTIDGAATYALNTNYEAVTFVYNGTEWNVMA